MIWKLSTLVVVAVLILSVLVSAAPCSHAHRNHYPGWAGIKHIFAFGDSYTTTGFNLTSTQPGPENPLGNPAYPGHSSSNGPNWIDYLTTTYNKTFIETVNLAYGGATIDSALVAPYLPTVVSIKNQVQSEFLSTYASHPSFFPWTSDDTLFTIFIGINDIGNSYASHNVTLLPIIFNELSSLVDRLYTSGARNFLFLNVPPIDLSPLTKTAGPTSQALEAAAIKDWNTRLSSLSTSLAKRHTDATCFIFDTHRVFKRIMEHPCAYPQTCAYRNTTGFCKAYENGTTTVDYFDAACGVSVDEYLWLNSLHPTFRLHEVVAAQIVKLII